jgi:hypothetical protein
MIDGCQVLGRHALEALAGWWVEQALSNYLTNAIQQTAAGVPRI